MILSPAKAQLRVIDVQEKLAPAAREAGPVIANSASTPDFKALPPLLK